MFSFRAAVVALSFLSLPAAAELNSSPIPVLRGNPVITPDVLAPQTPSSPTVDRSLVPPARPKGFAARVQTIFSTQKSYSQSGSVCGVPSIRGQVQSAIPAKLAGCGLQSPVRITEVSGVKLSTPATIDCTTAKALKTWIDKGAAPAVGNRGGGLAELKVVASYACRTRNNQPGAKVSEHGAGRAIDIAGYSMKNGDTVTLLKGWNSNAYGKTLRKMHSAACGPFGTVLGPNANRFHLDHFHFDTARYRSGSYCR
jgi:hypothetical protein